jgi:cell division protein FtsL
VGNLDEMDLFFIVLLVVCAAALVYTVFAWLQSVAQWKSAITETLMLQRESNSLLREISGKLDRDQVS